ncbi:MAG: Uma2 family endonuclease [Planctomycetota bacterium]
MASLPHASARSLPTPTRSETPRGLPRAHHWTCDEYDALIERGALEGLRVELVAGTIVEMSPQQEAHVEVIELTRLALASAFGPTHWVRVQSPLQAGEDSKPEPDLAVVEGRPGGADRHPSAAVLVVEVSLSSLDYDRHDKASIYAAAGFADYWVVDVVGRRIVVFRDPAADPAAPHGASYRTISTHLPGDPVRPIALPGAVIDPADCFLSL